MSPLRAVTVTKSIHSTLFFSFFFLSFFLCFFFFFFCMIDINISSSGSQGVTPSGSESERASMDGMEVERRMSCQGVRE